MSKEKRPAAVTAAGQDKAAPDDRDRTARIRDLNDRFRTTLAGGKVVMTSGVAALAANHLLTVLTKVTAFDSFTPDNDPYSEHDFGAFESGGERFFWKIDYYDPTLTAGSNDPADRDQTCRVLTVMLASEY
jgi:hypothetical protein